MIRTLGAAMLAAGLLPAATHAQNQKVDLGINLTGINYYSRELPFIDVFKGWEPFTTTVGTATYDALGNPTSLSGGGNIRSIWDKPIGLAAGTYVMLYDGNATFTLDAVSTVSSSNGRRVFRFNSSDPAVKTRMMMNIKSVDAANPIRNIRVVPLDQEGDFKTGTPNYIWNNTFVNDWKGFSAGYRFMDWGSTNSSPVVTWADRTTPAHAVQGGVRNNTNSARGVALEYQIQLANQTGKDAWFCIPHQADDNYIRQMATMIRDHLDPKLKAKIEYSNEVWNWSFDQAYYARDEGKKLWPEKSDSEAMWNFIGKRSDQAFGIFNDVFSRSGANPQELNRLVRIGGTQKGSLTVTKRLLEQTGNGARLDAIAIAPYWGKVLRRQSNADEVVWVNAYKAMTWDQRVQEAWDQLYETMERVHLHRAEINKYNKNVKLVAYEGGQHYVTGGDWDRDAEMVGLFHELNRRPEMRDMYLAYLQEWQRAGGQEFQLFSSTGTYTGFGQWGLQEQMNAPLANSPKLQGVHDYMHAGNATPVAPQKQLFKDDFNNANAWTKTGNATATTVGGKQVLDLSNGVSSLVRSINATGLKNLALKLTAFQNNASFEGLGRGGDDWIKIFVDYGNGDGWQLLLVDDAVWGGTLDAASYDNASLNIVSDHGQTGATSGISTPWLAFSELADNNAGLRLMIQTQTSASGEKYFLDSLEIGGTAIPEPTSAAALLGGSVLLLRRRRSA